MGSAAGDGGDDVFAIGVGVGQGVERGGRGDRERLVDLIAFGTYPDSMNFYKSKLITRGL